MDFQTLFQIHLLIRMNNLCKQYRGNFSILNISTKFRKKVCFVTFMEGMIAFDVKQPVEGHDVLRFNTTYKQDEENLCLLMIDFTTHLSAFVNHVQ